MSGFGFTENMQQLSPDPAITNRFISSLSKSLQALCHGCMDFENGIEIVGFINVNIDSNSKVDYVLNEKVQKSTNNSMTFVSNSFLAKKDIPKQTRDGSCSPVPELNTLHTAQKICPEYALHRPSNLYPTKSHSLQGSQKRSLSHIDTQWQCSPRKQFPDSKTCESDWQLSKTSSSNQSLSQSLPSMQMLTKTPNSNTEGYHNVKKEACDSDFHSAQEDTVTMHELGNIKSDPDYSSESIEKTGGTWVHPNNDSFLHNSLDQVPNDCEIPRNLSSETKPTNDSQYFMSEMNLSNKSKHELVQNEYFDDCGESSADVIEIDDEDDEDIKSMFGHIRNNVSLKRNHWQASNNAHDIFQDERTGLASTGTFYTSTTAEDMFKCVFCQEIIQVSSLKSHLTQFHSHMVTSPYTCPHCAKGYWTKKNFSRHLVTHTDGFFCPICSIRITQKYNVKIHLKTQHFSAQCPTCTKIFPTGDVFNKHILHCVDKKAS